MTSGTLSGADVHRLTRRLRARAEPICGVVFQAKEARRGCLGLDPIAWYVASRAACLGPVRAPVAAAVFATMNPSLVERALTGVWERVSVEQVLTARLASATAELERIFDASSPPAGYERIESVLWEAATAPGPEGAPMYAGLRALGIPASGWARLWRACDLIREHRGDCHTNAWRAAGLDAVEINVLSEAWKGQAIGSVATAQMGWSKDDVAAAARRLTAAGLLDGSRLTRDGQELRERIEFDTSLQQAAIAEVLAPYSDEVLDWLTDVARRCSEAAVAYWQSGTGATG